MFLRASLANAFTWIFISGVEILHILYVDDVMMISSWDPKNVNRLIHILRCFYMASRLKINMLKIKLIGVGVLFSQVSSVVERIDCAASNLPFFHLGVSVGKTMTCVSAWSSIL